MATQTTNLGLTKPAGSENALVSVLNQNFELIDESAGKANGAMAIYITGNTAPAAISAGAFVCWKGDLYTARSNIASGDTLSSTNLESVVHGGLNALSEVVCGRAIAANTDLNTITEPGMYGVALNSTAQTLQNCPVDKTFTMLVIKKSNDPASGFVQVIFAGIAGEIYMRNVGSSGSGYSFGSWNNKSSTEDFTSSVTFSETVPSNTFMKKTGNLVTIMYQGESKAHSANANLFTLPSGYRPASPVFAPFVKNGNAYGIIQISTAGACTVNQISSTSATGRIYFCITFPV